MKQLTVWTTTLLLVSASPPETAASHERYRTMCLAPVPAAGPHQALQPPVRTEPWYPLSAYTALPPWAYTGPAVLLPPSLGPNHSDVVAVLDALAKARQEQEGLLEATSYARRAAVIFERQYGPNHPHVATTLQILGTIYHELADLEAAGAYYSRSPATYHATLPKYQPYVAAGYNNLGLLLLSLAEQAGPHEAVVLRELARMLFEQALAICQVVYGPGHVNTVTTLQNLGAALEALGDVTGAMGYYLQAGTVMEKQKAVGSGK